VADGRPEIPRELRIWEEKVAKEEEIPTVSSIFYGGTMGNVRSLVNKMDELTSLTKSKSVFGEGSVMCFTETWLHDNVPDTTVS